MKRSLCHFNINILSVSESSSAPPTRGRHWGTFMWTFLLFFFVFQQACAAACVRNSGDKQRLSERLPAAAVMDVDGNARRRNRSPVKVRLHHCLRLLTDRSAETTASCWLSFTSRLHFSFSHAVDFLISWTIERRRHVTWTIPLSRCVSELNCGTIIDPI